MKPLKIIQFEDNEVISQVIKKKLERLNIDITLRQKSNAILSIVEIASFDPDIIIADLNLPIRNFDFYIKKIRKEGKPIIIYTGCDEEEAVCRIKTALGEIPNDVIFCYKCDGFNKIEIAINKIKGLK